jgi:hypothetical protein
MDNIVYIVHCIDTEGPLYESIEATFERVKDVFGFSFEPSLETLKKLQNKEIDLGGKEEAVCNLVAPKRINFNSTWDKIDEMLDRITNKDFRQKHQDSFSGLWTSNWFCVDHVGYNDVNPRRRDIGYHNIFDHYRLYFKLNGVEDMIQWHYHPLAFIKEAHRSGNAFIGSDNIFNILTRRIVERFWFPAVYRPGFHTERPGANWFLEQWIPFDYGNQRTKAKESDQPDLIGGRYGDWRRAPLSWRPYHPDIYDYQKEGNCNRWITRCLNMEARLRELSTEDVRDAFQEARERGKALLAFTNHDFRNMEPEINKVWKIIKNVSQDFPDVKFKFSDAVSGMRKMTGLEDLTAPNFDISLDIKPHKAILRVRAQNNLFGVQPFLAVKTKSHLYFWENFDFQDNNLWTYVFDYNNLRIRAVDKIGIAANTDSGVTEVAVLDVSKNQITKKVLNK